MKKQVEKKEEVVAEVDTTSTTDPNREMALRMASLKSTAYDIMMEIKRLQEILRQIETNIVEIGKQATQSE